ncbi:sialidase [Flavobacteriaceae bacterium]|nr:sialidase [Flavobacteriaceae bacterium]MDB4255713.1 sialidase [Flavobacteriaceae bacterium]
MKKFIFFFSLLATMSCSTKEVYIQEIPFFYENSNAQPNLVSSNGSLTLSWISSKEENKASLNYSRYMEGRWIKPQVIASGSDWFINWADFPAHAINQDLIITSHLKKSASGKYTYDVVLNLQKLSGEKIKEDFLLNTDGVKAEHGFVSIIANNKKGFFITWLDGRNTIEKKLDGDHKPMTIRFAEITDKGDVIKESELDASTCDCCQTSIAITNDGPIVVYRDRGEKEVRDIYSVKNINGTWEEPNVVHDDGWIINGCPVNGPKVAVNSKDLAIAWFTVSNDNPLVNVSFSKNNGNSFGAPVKVNDHDAIGRVDVSFLNDKEVIVSYMEVDDIGTYLRIKKVSFDGKISEPITISKIDGGRNTGVPQLEIIDSEIFIVWTISLDGMNQLKSIKLNSKNI